MATTELRPGPDGRVRIYDLSQKAWTRVYFVDAKEMLERRTATLDGPNIEIYKDGAGRKMVLSDEVEGALAEGWQLVPEQELPPNLLKTLAESKKPVPKLEGDMLKELEAKNKKGNESEDVPYDFTVHDLKELRAFGKTAKIKDYDSMTKPQLVEALDAAGFKP